MTKGHINLTPNSQTEKPLILSDLSVFPVSHPMHTVDKAV